jgi:hypothetical protein
MRKDWKMMQEIAFRVPNHFCLLLNEVLGKFLQKPPLSGVQNKTLNLVCSSFQKTENESFNNGPELCLDERRNKKVYLLYFVYYLIESKINKINIGLRTL